MKRTNIAVLAKTIAPQKGLRQQRAPRRARGRLGSNLVGHERKTELLGQIDLVGVRPNVWSVHEVRVESDRVGKSGMALD